MKLIASIVVLFMVGQVQAKPVNCYNHDYQLIFGFDVEKNTFGFTQYCWGTFCRSGEAVGKEIALTEGDKKDQVDKKYQIELQADSPLINPIDKKVLFFSINNNKSKATLSAESDEGFFRSIQLECYESEP